MTDRVNLSELQQVVSKAVAEVVHSRTIGHGPIICGFVAPDALAPAEAEKIAAQIAKSVPGSRPTVNGGAEHMDARKAPAGLPRGPIIIGLVFEAK